MCIRDRSSAVWKPSCVKLVLAFGVVASVSPSSVHRYEVPGVDWSIRSSSAPTGTGDAGDRVKAAVNGMGHGDEQPCEASKLDLVVCRVATMRSPCPAVNRVWQTFSP